MLSSEDKNTHYTAAQLFNNCDELVTEVAIGSPLYKCYPIYIKGNKYQLFVDIINGNTKGLYLNRGYGKHIEIINCSPNFKSTKQAYKHLVKEYKRLSKLFEKYSKELKWLIKKTKS